MKIIEHETEHEIRVEFYIHRAVYKTKHIIKAMFNYMPNSIFNYKMKIVDELDESDFQFKGRKKEIIKEWSKVDERFVEVYKELYPRGGSRKNAGRPQGSRTDKTERLEYAITKEEKKYLIECLESFRRQKLFVEQFPDEAKKINPAMLPYYAEGAILNGKIKVKSLSQIPERVEDIKNANRLKAKEIVRKKIKENGIDKKAEEGLNYIKEITQEVVEIDGQHYFRAKPDSTKEQRKTGFSLPENEK